MPSKEEIEVVRKATIYDLMKIIKKGAKGKENHSYTPEELEDLMDAYIIGTEQS